MGNNLSVVRVRTLAAAHQDQLIPFVAVPVVSGAVIGISIAPEIKGWYKKLRKPSWNPPNWVFGPTWTVLYTLMGIASWRVWSKGGGTVPLSLYGAQLALNLAWSPIFFKLHNPKAATAEMTGLLGVLAATIVEFRKVDEAAAAMLLPYAAWSTFAAALTFKVWQLNKDGAGPVEGEKKDE